MKKNIHLSGKLAILLFWSMLFVTLFACKKTTTDSGNSIYDITLDISTASMEVGDTIVLKSIFNDGKVTDPNGNYNWKSTDPSVVSVAMNKDLSVTLTARKQGKSTIRLISIDRLEVIDSAEITVVAAPDGIIRILAVGNSFSVDAVEDYLYNLAKEAEIPIIIGSLAISSGSLEQHLSNGQDNAAVYNYTKIGVDGSKTTTFDNVLQPILSSERWDYISFQQVSGNSGVYSTFESSLAPLVDYVKQQVISPDVKFILHQTWAYAQNAAHPDFINYDKDQQKMYEAIVETYNKAQQLADIEFIVPVGTAIQNGRTSAIGDNFNRDGTHLETSYGRYTAACTWFEKLFGQSVVGYMFKPTGLSDYNKEIAQHAAHFAVLEPNQVTELVDYQAGDGNSGDGQGVIQVSFGGGSGMGWNSLTLEQSKDGTIPNLIDKLGNPTSISLSVLERFNGQNDGGAGSTETPLDLPPSVSSSSLFGNSLLPHNGLTVEQSVIKLVGLDKDITYNFCFFGSRMSVTDNRDTKFIVKGQNELSTNLNTSNNTSDIACVDGIQPNDMGEITITITMGDENTNGQGFYYISALEMTPAT